jgi:hypothetical protein
MGKVLSFPRLIAKDRAGHDPARVIGVAFQMACNNLRLNPTRMSRPQAYGLLLSRIVESARRGTLSVEGLAEDALNYLHHVECDAG